MCKAVVFVSLVGFVIVEKSALSTGTPVPGKDGAVCNTAICRTIAKKFLERINSSADPCEDFYEYSCGKWIAKQGNYDINDWSSLADKTVQAGIGLLNGTIKPKGPTFESETKIRTFYEQCIDRADAERLRGTSVIRILEDFMDGWPLVTPRWNSSKFHILNTLTESFLRGSQPFFFVSIMPDVQNPSVNLIQLDTPKLFYKTSDLLKNKGTSKPFRNVYPQTILNATKLLLRDANISLSNETEHLLAGDIEDIVRVESFLISNMLTKSESKNDTLRLNKYTLKEFKNRYQFTSAALLNMTEYLKSLLSATNLADVVTENTTIVIPNLKFWAKLDELLTEMEQQGEEGKRRMANFIGWQFIYGALLNGILSKEYSALIVATPDWEHVCLKLSKDVLPLAMGALYVRDIVPKDLKEKATQMVTAIHYGFRELLEGATWIDNVTHVQAMDKLEAVKEIVAYPDFMEANTSFIDDEYRTVSLEKTFVSTYYRTIKDTVILRLHSLIQKNLRYDPVQDTHSDIPTKDISQVNAYYEPRVNLLNILGAVLRLPFFDANAPQYVNYGGIGYIIGHELTHGFDTIGGQYDANGAMRTWWTTATLVKFKDRAKGLLAQYDKYTMPTGKVNGELTLNENIADNGGIKAAFKGYIRHLDNLTTSEPILPGLENFTPLQLFFLSAAQIWCEKSTPGSEQRKLLTDPHSPFKWRVNGAMSNMPEFAKSYNCSIDQKMHPKSKHGVW